MKRRHRRGPVVVMPSGFAGYRFPPEVVLVAVRMYLRFALSYRDLEELLAERGVEVDHTSLYRCVQRFAPQLVDAAAPSRHSAGDRWFVDETYLKVSGEGRYVYRGRRPARPGHRRARLHHPDKAVARQFFARALLVASALVEVVTDKARAYPAVSDELPPQAFHNIGRYANNTVEADPGRLKSRPMRGLRTSRTAWVSVTGYSFVQNLRRGLYDWLSTLHQETVSPPRSPNSPQRTNRNRSGHRLCHPFRHQHRLLSPTRRRHGDSYRRPAPIPRVKRECNSPVRRARAFDESHSLSHDCQTSYNARSGNKVGPRRTT